MHKIKIAEQFSETPGGRYQKEGPFSGEEFREKFLIPKYREAKEASSVLEIDLDGVYGYPTSFLDEAFGGLAIAEKSHSVMKNIRLISNDQPGLVDLIKKIVQDVSF